MPDFEKISSFLEEYTCFFSRYSDFQKLKLQDVLSNKLTRLDESLKNGEKLQMELNNIESKRLVLFKQQGLEGRTFKEIIAIAPDEYKMRMQSTFDSLSFSLSESNFHNKKAMSVLGDRMNELRLKKNLPHDEFHHTLSKKI